MRSEANRRRRNPRARRRLKVKLPHCRAFTADIGAGGFSAEVLRVLPPGTAVDGTIEVGDRAVPFAGRVAWAKAGDPYLGLRGRMGILFTTVAVELLDLLGSLGGGLGT